MELDDFIYRCFDFNVITVKHLPTGKLLNFVIQFLKALLQVGGKRIEEFTYAVENQRKHQVYPIQVAQLRVKRNHRKNVRNRLFPFIRIPEKASKYI